MEDEHGKRMNLITRERLLKADLHITRDAAGYINRAEVDDSTILTYLVGACRTFQIDKPVLDYGHLSAAATYSLWQYAFIKPFFAEPRKIYLIELLGDYQHGSDSEAAYRMLLRRIDRRHQSVIERAITASVTQHNLAMVHEARYRFVPAFDELLRLIPQIEEQLADIAGRE
jgi:hypothetical protein